MTINQMTKADLRAMCSAIFILLLHISPSCVYAGAPSVVLQHRTALVTTYTDDMKKKGQGGEGTGFFVDKSGVIAVGYKAIEAILGEHDSPRTALFVRTEDGSYLQIEQIVAADKVHGIALVKVGLPDPPVVTLSPDDGPVSGETVFIAGKRSAHGDGVIEGKTALLPDGEEVVILTSSPPPGITGCPIYNSAGKVIGMLARKTADDRTVNHLVSAVYIQGLLEKYRNSGPQHGALFPLEEDTAPGTDELEEKLDKAKSLVEQDPGNVRALVMLGWAYSKLGMYADALDAYKGAASLRPGYAGIYNNIGVIYAMDMGMYDKAVVEFRKALQLKPDYDEARYNLAITYVFSDDRDSALKEYRKLRKTDPERAAKLFGLIYNKQEGEDDSPGQR
jgi:Trypsin-like peptidase domain/Tetratricopeptide repeat